MISKIDLDSLVQFCYWYEKDEFINLWMRAGADRSLAEHLFTKFIQHNNGLDITGFYANLDNTNKERFVAILRLYQARHKKI